jgi:hypothetical protein
MQPSLPTFDLVKISSLVVVVFLVVWALYYMYQKMFMEHLIDYRTQNLLGGDRQFTSPHKDPIFD